MQKYQVPVMATDPEISPIAEGVRQQTALHCGAMGTDRPVSLN